MVNNYLEMYINNENILSIITKLSSDIKGSIFILNHQYAITHYTYTKEHLEDLLAILPGFVADLNHLSHTYVSPNQQHYTSFPLVFSNTLLGWLCVEHSKPLDADITPCTQVISIMLANEQKIYELETSLKGELVDALLNLSNQGLHDFQRKFIVYFQNLYCVVLLTTQTEQNKHRYHTLMSETLQEVNPKSLLLTRDDEIIVVLDVSDENSSIVVDQLLTLFSEKACADNVLKDHRTTYKIGVSHDYRGIEKFKTCYHEALTALRLSRSNTTSFYRDLELKHFILNTPQEDRKNFLQRNLGALMSYKKPQNEEFLQTLVIYLRTNRNWTETKNILNIHGNTLTYRLQRISEILKIDLNNYEDTLKLQLALEIKDVVNTKLPT